MTSTIHFILLFVIHQSNALVAINENMNSFSHAQKNGHCVFGEEIILYERSGPPGVITEQWFTGLDCFRNDSIIRYYIDGDNTPTIEGELFMMHGIGFYNRSEAKPWGHKWMGHLATEGGLYNTFRVPYQRSITITLEAKKKVPEQFHMFWFIVRGMENYPVVIGDLILPSTARLRLQKITNKLYNVYDYVTVASSKKSGLLFMAALAGQSSDFNYLEGCYRFCASNDSNVQYLSSGTEDFFLSAYYYDLGLYHTEHAGLTYLQNPGTMSAYKIFASDPVLFKGPFSLVWRQSEKQDNACFIRSGYESCKTFDDGHVAVVPTREEHPSKPMFAKTVISSYVWFYEW